MPCTNLQLTLHDEQRTQGGDAHSEEGSLCGTKTKVAPPHLDGKHVCRHLQPAIQPRPLLPVVTVNTRQQQQRDCLGPHARHWQQAVTGRLGTAFAFMNNVASACRLLHMTRGAVQQQREDANLSWAGAASVLAVASTVALCQHHSCMIQRHRALHAMNCSSRHMSVVCT